MNHEMRLENMAFSKIKAGEKTVELRLNDVKRRAVKVGDTITFTNRANNELLDVSVTGLKKFKNFAELFENYSKEEMGVSDDTTFEVMNEYYSDEERKKYGALAIEIKLK